MTEQTDSPEPQYRVRGKDRLSDDWVVFTGTLAECRAWAEARAFTLHAPVPVEQ